MYITCVIQQQEKLQDECTLHHGQQGTCQIRKRMSKDPNVEGNLSQWFSIVIGQSTIRISGPMLESKSEELAKKVCHNDLKATDGWFLMEIRVWDKVQEGKQ
jgi:hypothetical protein